MSPPDRPVFLARESYHQRRLMDAAKLLPVIGAAAFLFPVLWAARAQTGAGLVYIFGVWVLLIGVAFWLSRRLSADTTPGAAAEAAPDDDPGPGP